MLLGDTAVRIRPLLPGPLPGLWAVVVCGGRVSWAGDAVWRKESEMCVLRVGCGCTRGGDTLSSAVEALVRKSRGRRRRICSTCEYTWCVEGRTCSFVALVRERRSVLLAFLSLRRGRFA